MSTASRQAARRARARARAQVKAPPTPEVVPAPAAPPAPVVSIAPSWLEKYHWVVALLGYAAVSVVIAYPALANLNGRVIGESWGDNTWYVWYLWIFRHSVLSFQDPGHTHYVFALLPSVQVFIEALFADVVAFPLQWLMTPVAAYDLTIILSFVLSGLTMYLLAGEFVKNRLACFAAGFFYTFSTFHFARAQGHLGLLTLQWLPFCAWRLFALYRRPSVGNALLAGVGLALVPFSEVYFVPYFEVPFVGLFVLAVLITDRGWVANRRNLKLSGLAVLVAGVVAVPYLATFAFVDPDLRASMIPAGLEQYSADLLAFVVPSNASPVYGHLTLPIYQAMQQHGGEETGFLGYPALLLAAIALALRRNLDRAARFWLVFALAGVVLAFGPVLHVLGNSVVPVPAYNLMFGWGPFSSFRAPSRLSVVPLMAVSVLAAYGIAAVMDRFDANHIARIVITGAVACLLLETVFENSNNNLTLTTSAVPVPAVYAQIARDKTPGLLLDIPFGVPISEKYQHYQVVHGRPLVFGSLPRTSDRMINSVLGQPSLAQFYMWGAPGATRLQGHADIYPVSLDLKYDLQRDHVRYVVLHRADLLPADSWVVGYLTRDLGKPFYRNDVDGLMAWRVGGPLVANPATRFYEFTLGAGWLAGLGSNGGVPMRQMSQDGGIIIQAPRTSRRTLQFDAFADFRPQTMQVYFNGKVVATERFVAPGVVQTVTLPNLRLQASGNVLQIHSVQGCEQASAAVRGSADPRCFSFGIERMRWGHH